MITLFLKMKNNFWLRILKMMINDYADDDGMYQW